MKKSLKKKTKTTKFTTAKKAKTKTPTAAKPVKSHFVPVTVELLNETRKELIHRFDSGLHELAGRLDRRIDGNQAAIQELGSIMLQGFADLKSEIGGMRSEMTEMKFEIREVKSEINHVKSEVSHVKSEINGMKSEINGMKSEISGIKSEIRGIKSEMSGMRSEFKAELHAQRAMYEEQQARNHYVLDGYALLHERQERIENSQSKPTAKNGTR